MTAGFPLPKSPCGLRQPVIFQNPILNAALNPGRPVLVCNSAFQFRREGVRITINPFDQAGVPQPMQVVEMAVQDHVAVVSSLVAVVLIVQGLVGSPTKWITNFSAYALVAGSALESFRTGRKCSVWAITH